MAPKLALILGSGFSKNVGLPTTSCLSKKFLITPDYVDDNKKRMEEDISKVLKEFWKDIFGYDGDSKPPSMEDHFTLLDLAANSGHHLGKAYNPKRLRAIRRMSIHRVFTLLNNPVSDDREVKKFLATLLDRNKYDVSIITLNWDIVIEKRFPNDAATKFDYGIKVFNQDNTPTGGGPSNLLKLHGSANWTYCDTCRRIFADFDEKNTLRLNSFLEKDDFELFADTKGKDYPPCDNPNNMDRECRNCNSQLAGRVATFSFRKAFSISQFQIIWEAAFRELSIANKWLFIGYSLPDADYEFKHLLKAAQLARSHPEGWKGMVAYGGDKKTKENYTRFFSDRDVVYHRLKDGASLNLMLASSKFMNFMKASQ